jgi:site-specific DNA-methyltransferase (adenine-specific)
MKPLKEVIKMAVTKKKLKQASLEELQKENHGESIVIRQREYPIIDIIDGDKEHLPTIVPELAGNKPPDPRAYAVLEQRILRDGVVEPLVAAYIGGQLVLLDGHMRLDIIIKHRIKQFKIVVVELPSIEAARWWTVEQTYSYRHLNQFVRTEFALDAMPRYQELAAENRKLAGKYKGNIKKLKTVFKPIDCLEEIGKSAKASKTIVSAVRYILKNGRPDEIQQCRTGETKIGTMHQRIQDRIRITDEWKKKTNGANDDVVFENPKAGEYYNQVIQGDCLRVIKGMYLDGINNIDLVITSPPYFGASKDYGPDHKDFSCYDEYLHFLAEFIYLCQRVGNDGMRICIIIDAMNRQNPKDGEDYKYPVTHDLVRIVHELNAKNSDCDLRYLGEFHWYKNHSGGKNTLGSFSPMKPVIRNDGESILVWIKGQKEFQNIDEKLAVATCENPDHLLTKQEYMEYTLGTWSIQPNADKYRHPAKFPAEIPHRLIKLLSFPGQVVLDPMCGSGVTLKAARDLGRKFIGIDQNASFCQMSKDRLDGIRRKEEAA